MKLVRENNDSTRNISNNFADLKNSELNRETESNEKWHQHALQFKSW